MVKLGVQTNSVQVRKFISKFERTLDSELGKAVDKIGLTAQQRAKQILISAPILSQNVEKQIVAESLTKTTFGGKKESRVRIQGNQAAALANEFGQRVHFISFRDNAEAKAWATRKGLTKLLENGGMIVGKAPNSRHVLGASKNIFMKPAANFAFGKAKPILTEHIQSAARAAGATTT